MAGKYERAKRIVQRNARNKRDLTAPKAMDGLRALVADGTLKPAELADIRTVREWIAAARQTEGLELHRDDEVYWPESFGEGALLPWEASQAYFELLRFIADEYPESSHGRRLLYPLVEWFWRLSRAAPERSAHDRWSMAWTLAFAEEATHYGAPEHALSRLCRAWEAWLRTGEPFSEDVEHDVLDASGILDAVADIEAEALGTVRSTELMFGAFTLAERISAVDKVKSAIEESRVELEPWRQ